MFACAFILETVNRIVAKSCFPQEALTDLNAAMRAVVIVNGSALAGTPAQHQHLHKLVPTNSMPPVVAFLETEIRFQLFGRDLCLFQPLIDLCEFGRAVQRFKRRD